MNRKIIYIFVFTLSLSLSASSLSNAFQPQTLTVRAVSSSDRIPAGGEFQIAVIVDIEAGFHINSNKPLEEAYKATLVSYQLTDGVSFGKVYYPEGEIKKFEFAISDLSIYEHQITIITEVELSDQLNPGKITLEGYLDYQACNDKICYLPAREEFEISIELVGKNEIASAVNQEYFTDYASLKEFGKNQRNELFLTRQERQAKKVLEKGFFYAMAAFFLFGLALNLTPCVYPVIPITVSYFSAQSNKNKRDSISKSVLYVVGIAIVFAVLGLLSGLAGKQWGFLFQNPWFVIVVTVIILAMAASMFGAFEIKVPASLLNKFGHSQEGPVGAFLMGLTVGVVIAPCAAGVLIGLVGLVAKLGIVAEGSLLFFIMGLGLGLPYLILANFSVLLKKMPKSGMWMVWIKKIFGIMLVGVALYFFLPQAKHIPDLQGYFFGLLIIFGGVLLGFLDSPQDYTKGFKRIKWLIGTAAILFGVYVTGNSIQEKAQDIDWHFYSNEDLNTLLVEGKPLFFDFYADWCAPCKEMDQKTFTVQDVIDLTPKFTMVKVDCTAPNSTVRDFMEGLQVTGMPTLIFMDNRGNELKELREVGFIEAEIFIGSMDKVLSVSSATN